MKKAKPRLNKPEFGEALPHDLAAEIKRLGPGKRRRHWTSRRWKRSYAVRLWDSPCAWQSRG